MITIQWMISFNPITGCGLGTIIISIFQRRKLRFRDIMVLAQGHTAIRVLKLRLKPRNYHQHAPCLQWEAISLVCGGQRGIRGKIPIGLVVLILSWSVLHFIFQIL